jgi:hypothetical protein
MAKVKRGGGKRRGEARGAAATGQRVDKETVEDSFTEAFKGARGKVDAGLKLGFDAPIPPHASNRIPS